MEKLCVILFLSLSICTWGQEVLPIEKYYYSRNLDGRLVLTSQELLEYGAGDHPIRLVSNNPVLDETGQLKKWVPWRDYSYSYNAAGKEKRRVTHKYSYRESEDLSWKRATEWWTRGFNEDGKLTNTLRYEEAYDREGTLTNIYAYRQVFSYDNSGCLVEREVDELRSTAEEAQIWEHQGLDTYENNSDCQPIREGHFAPNGELEVSTIYKYNSQGQRTNTRRLIASSNTIQIRNYEYEGDNISKNEYLEINSTTADTFKQVTFYSFDDLGRETSAYQMVFDSSHPNGVQLWERDFTYFQETDKIATFYNYNCANATGTMFQDSICYESYSISSFISNGAIQEELYWSKTYQNSVLTDSSSSQRIYEYLCEEGAYLSKTIRFYTENGQGDTSHQTEYFYPDFLNCAPNKTPINEILLFPNPSSNTINIYSDLLNEEKVEVRIFDALGRQYYDNTISFFEILRINISDFSSGLYYVQINSGELIETNSFVVNSNY